MQPRLDLFLIPLVIQRQQPRQHLAPSRFADGVPHPLRRLVKAVTQVQVVPAIRGGHSLIHLDVQRAQPGNIRAVLIRIVEAVVGFGQPLLTGQHDLAAVLVVLLSDGG